MIRKKICLSCNNEFEVIGSNQKYCSASCREKVRYQKRKEYVQTTNKQWRIKNKEKLDKYYEDNKEKRKTSTIEWRNNNKDKVRQNARDWYSNNKEKRRESAKKYYQTIKYKEKTILNRRMRKGIYKSLRDKKSHSWLSLVDYSLEELKEHLITTLYDTFTWEDYLNGRMHIDHIIPISSYDIIDSSCEEFKKCWSLKNLRLLEASKNMSKQDDVKWDLIEQFDLYNILPNKLNPKRRKFNGKIQSRFCNK